MNENLELMKMISNGDIIENENINQLALKDDTTNKLKLFILAQAKKELNNIISLTQFLDKVQDRYIELVENNLEELNIRQLSDIIYNIQSSIDRSNNLIKLVLKDETLTNVLIVNNNQRISNNNINNINATLDSNSINGLDTPESRDKVIKIANSILSKLSEEEDNIKNNE